MGIRVRISVDGTPHFWLWFVVRIISLLQAWAAIAAVDIYDSDLFALLSDWLLPPRSRAPLFPSLLLLTFGFLSVVDG